MSQPWVQLETIARVGNDLSSRIGGASITPQPARPDKIKIKETWNRSWSIACTTAPWAMSLDLATAG